MNNQDFIDRYSRNLFRRDLLKLWAELMLGFEYHPRPEYFGDRYSGYNYDSVRDIGANKHVVNNMGRN